MDLESNKAPSLPMPTLPPVSGGNFDVGNNGGLPMTDRSFAQTPAPLQTVPLHAAPRDNTVIPVDPTVNLAVPADDSNTDALDQEWVNKAKAIVEQTKNDPFLESKELSKVKADYLKIRYNKHIKVVED